MCEGGWRAQSEFSYKNWSETRMFHAAIAV